MTPDRAGARRQKRSAERDAVAAEFGGDGHRRSPPRSGVSRPGEAVRAVRGQFGAGLAGGQLGLDLYGLRDKLAARGVTYAEHGTA